MNEYKVDTRTNPLMVHKEYNYWYILLIYFFMNLGIIHVFGEKNQSTNDRG